MKLLPISASTTTMMLLSMIGIRVRPVVSSFAILRDVESRISCFSSHASTTTTTTTTRITSPTRKTRNSLRASAVPDDRHALYRADRVLANRSGMSRKECFRLLQQRKVVLLEDDGTTQRAINGPSEHIAMNAPLLWSLGDQKDDPTRRQQATVPLPAPLLMVYHKPKWVLSVRKDPHQRPCLDDSLMPDNMHPVGRLDYDTSGLLLLSSSGVLTQTLLHPKHGISKHYAAVVDGIVNPTELHTQLAQGIETTEGVHRAELVECQHWTNVTEVQAYLQEILRNLPPEYQKPNRTNDGEDEDDLLLFRGHLKVLKTSTQLSTVRLIVQEGKHRMVRRMLANCGHAVVSLQRTQLGVIELGNVPPGSLRSLTDTELEWAEGLLPPQPTGKKKGKKRRVALQVAARKKASNRSI